jgi:hypothetical protein
VIIPIESEKWRVKINIAARVNDMKGSGVIKGATNIRSQPVSRAEQTPQNRFVLEKLAASQIMEKFKYFFNWSRKITSMFIGY